MWIKDPKDGKKSVTLTFFSLGFIIALTKLLLSGVIINKLKLEAFSGTDFAAVIASLGGIYALRRHRMNKKEE